MGDWAQSPDLVSNPVDDLMEQHEDGDLPLLQDYLESGRGCRGVSFNALKILSKLSTDGSNIETGNSETIGSNSLAPQRLCNRSIGTAYKPAA